MALHSLTKSAIFFCVGHVAQVKGTQRMADIRGLTVTHPLLGWGLGLGVVAIAGLPPMGLFMTEFLIVTTTFSRSPALAIILGLALLVALGALLLRLNGLAFGEPDERNDPDKASFLPIGLHLALVLAAGIWLPPALVAWFQHVASLLN
jgi:hydrogenase-4 component F